MMLPQSIVGIWSGAGQELAIIPLFWKLVNYSKAARIIGKARTSWILTVTEKATTTTR